MKLSQNCTIWSYDRVAKACLIAGNGRIYWREADLFREEYRDLCIIFGVCRKNKTEIRIRFRQSVKKNLCWFLTRKKGERQEEGVRFLPKSVIL